MKATTVNKSVIKLLKDRNLINDEDAARFLGLTYSEFKRVSSTYNVKDYFTDDI